MKKFLLALLMLGVSATYNLPIARVGEIHASPAKDESKRENSYLFVINFDTGSFDGKKITLNGNGQSNVIYFTDRPERKAGHMGVKKFKSLWVKGIESFDSVPPNASLSLISDEKENNSVMILSNPKVLGNSITFDVKLIEGSPPSDFNTGGLFIDEIALEKPLN